MSKQYGLIKPGNVFGSSDSEDDSTSKSKKPQPFGQNILQKKQIQKIHESAVAEDSSIFLYDEVYDDIQNKRNEVKKEKKAADAKKPKYINKLIEMAEKRKKEYEMRIERQVQKERLAEGEQFKDKESFVTAAYRQKLEEMKQAELEEKRQEYLESIGDVTKQSDLSGFYRHIYSQKIVDETDEPSQKEDVGTSSVIDKKLTKKNYRKRKSSEEEMDTSENPKESLTIKSEHINSNLDADSDFSVDSSSDESDKETKAQKPLDIKQPVEEIKVETEKSTAVPKIEPIVESETDEEVKIEIEKKPKIDIWAKRTVGDVLMEALQRYQERKALRESNGR